MTQEAIAELIGDPDRFAREMQDFRETAKVLSADHERMIDNYPDKWVALYSGEVRAFGDSIDSVLDEVDAKGIPRSQIIVRFIDTEPRTMILPG